MNCTVLYGISQGKVSTEKFEHTKILVRGTPEIVGTLRSVGSICTPTMSCPAPIDLQGIFVLFSVDGGPCRDRTYDQLIKRRVS
jgi:hypothetical protein